MRNIIIIAIIGMLLSGCVNPPQSGNNTTSSLPVMTSPNSTAPANQTQPTNATAPAQGNGSSQTQGPEQLPPGYTVNLGDNVSVMYSLYVDGALYDTNNATLANESGIFNPSRRYAPLNFTAQMGSGMIDGFVLGVIGMGLNETLSFRVDPERGYGNYDPAKVITVSRYYTQNLSEVIPRSYIDESVNISNGTSFKTNYGMVSIQDFNEDNVTIYFMALMNTGYKFTYNGITNEVVNATAYEATIERLFDVNASYVLPDPRTGQAARFKVTDKNDQNITLDSNSPLANKSLDFVVTMLGITPAPSR